MASFMSTSAKLRNGVEMPRIGFGTAFGNWTDKTEGKFLGLQPDLGYRAIPAALRAGYSHFDTAFLYGTHRILSNSLGAAMADGKSRNDFFVCTKVMHPAAPNLLNHCPKTFDFSDPNLDIKKRVHTDFEKSLDELSFGYVDLLLLHWPGDFESDDETVGMQRRKDAWEAMEEIYATGKARAIGVSNFLVRHLVPMMAEAKVMPMVNQIEISPYFRQVEVVEFCLANDIHPVAWSPFGSGSSGVLSDPVIAGLAEKYHKNVGQVILRWMLQQNISALPKSSSEARMRSNLDVFDFSMTVEEIDSINALNKDTTSSVSAASIA